ncbi:hypothetical protein CEXT_810711 [Caerostris extrusa]|uniref:Uncharacterized protein n=1 Tax=Caerostris extrusa TaxID=172846 RepID=A0AAV4QNF4_CAEEX|nr:hypothetical protein CEXT_810711 [Caerostris extrusa]
MTKLDYSRIYMDFCQILKPHGEDNWNLHLLPIRLPINWCFTVETPVNWKPAASEVGGQELSSGPISKRRMINNMDGGKIEEHICLLTTVIQMVREVKDGQLHIDGFDQQGSTILKLQQQPCLAKRSTFFDHDGRCWIKKQQLNKKICCEKGGASFASGAGAQVWRILPGGTGEGGLFRGTHLKSRVR